MPDPSQNPNNRKAVAQIVITMVENGEVHIACPPDKFMCYGLLGVAQDFVSKMKPLHITDQMPTQPPPKSPKDLGVIN